MSEIKKELQENLKVIDDYFEVSGIIDFIFSNNLNLFLWQHKRANEKRVFHYGRIHKVEKLEKIVRFVPSKTQGFRFDITAPLYIFSQDKCVAWKCWMKSCETSMVTGEYPQKLSQVERDYIEKLQFVEVEDEEKFKDQRAVPRKNAREGQMVGVERLKLGKVFTHFLYDLSQGGMAFLVDDPGEYEVGEQIRLTMLDGVEVEKKIEGEVVAIRKKEESLGEFKVCIKFVQ